MEAGMDGYGARSPRVNRAPRNRGGGHRAILEIASNMRRVAVQATAAILTPRYPRDRAESAIPLRFLQGNMRAAKARARTERAAIGLIASPSLGNFRC